MEKLEDCPNTVWPALSGLVGKVTDEEDSEMDPDYVPSAEESQDSLEYRSEMDSDIEELEDCPDTVWPALSGLVGKVTDEDSEMDPEYVPSTEESQDSLEYRSETDIEQEESSDIDSDMEELEDCPDTVWPALSGLVGNVTDEEDIELDPDYVPSAEESQDSLEYRSESEHEELEDCPTTIHYVEPNTVWPALSGLVGKVTDEEDSGMDPDYVLSAEESQDSLEYRSESEQDESQDFEELEDCPTTLYFVKVEHNIGMISDQSEDGSSTDESQDEDVEELEVVFENISAHKGVKVEQEEVFTSEKK
eukprot:GFUD01035589.1.p1 GENE.GFUD01035589.1~~GFUD01035589.1.p1  ORF type:complete len:306 (+),score=130.56 GFUD01035589.1:404-1321(+)